MTAYRLQITLKLALGVLLPEDGTHVSKHVRDAPSVFINNVMH
jgi:hypothetical protein